MKKLIAHSSWLIVIVFIISILGCAVINKKSDSAGSSTTTLEPQPLLKFGDVPVPAGFKLLPKDSYSFENTGVRVAVLKYRGRANADSVISFYKEQMPMYNWGLLNTIEYGQRLMNFDRETETCLITVEPRWNCTIITISLGPKAQLGKKGARPVK